MNKHPEVQILIDWRFQEHPLMMDLDWLGRYLSMSLHYLPRAIGHSFQTYSVTDPRVLYVRDAFS